jgi:hypothetical protein
MCDGLLHPMVKRPRLVRSQNGAETITKLRIKGATERKSIPNGDS